MVKKYKFDDFNTPTRPCLVLAGTSLLDYHMSFLKGEILNTCRLGKYVVPF